MPTQYRWQLPVVRHLHTLLRHSDARDGAVATDGNGFGDGAWRDYRQHAGLYGVLLQVDYSVYAAFLAIHEAVVLYHIWHMLPEDEGTQDVLGIYDHAEVVGEKHVLGPAPVHLDKGTVHTAETELLWGVHILVVLSFYVYKGNTFHRLEAFQKA